MHTLESLTSKLSSLKFISFDALSTAKVARLTINRPESLNALNAEVMQELSTAFKIVGESDCRCLILTGAGEKAFVAGADIKALTAMSPQQAHDFGVAGQSVFRKLEQMPFATIACINGFALGGGLELAMACDILIAVSTAKLGLPEVSLGLIPGFGGTQRIARAVGLMKAREMIFTAGFYTAEEGRDMGLINHVYPASELTAQTEKMATTIAGRGPLAVSMAKQAILKGWDLPLEEGLSLEAAFFGELFGSMDMKEGTSAFVQKRAPKFTGK